MSQRGLYAVVRRERHESVATFYAGRKRIAVVRGSRAYVLRALLATGLASAVVRLGEHRHRPRVALVGGKPSDRGT